MGGGEGSANHSSHPSSSEDLSSEYDFIDSCNSQNPSSVLSPSSDTKPSSRIYHEIKQSYKDLESRINDIEMVKNEIRRYRPGDWLYDMGGKNRCDYDIPKTTTLLLIGPRGSGKSSLVNRISNVFESGSFIPDRAQVSYNSHAGDGSYFLEEYMIPSQLASSFCIYDSRSLSEDFLENSKTLKNLMTKGVQHGQLVMRDSDDKVTRMHMSCKARHTQNCISEKRMVNFVIFVVNGQSVLNSMKSGDKKFSDMLTMNFNFPYLSFRDDKPVVVITHGDELGISDRALVRIYLGELLGVSPAKQIFDIPETCDAVTELTILNMLRYSLQHADRNLPFKKPPTKYVQVPYVHDFQERAYIILIMLLLFACLLIVLAPKHSENLAPKFVPKHPKFHIKWHEIRHLWFGE